jgi:hypothetical protein
MSGNMTYSYALSFNEAKVFEFALNKTNTQRGTLTPPLPPLGPQEFFSLLIQEQLATFTNTFRNAILQQVSTKLQDVFISDHGDPMVQKAVLSALGLLDTQF